MTRNEIWQESRPSRKMPAFHLLVLVLCAAVSFGGDFVNCSSDGPCIDGSGGDRFDDFINGDAQDVELANVGVDFVHLIGPRESPNACNRIAPGSTRSIFVPNSAIAVTVRAFRDGSMLGEVTCDLDRLVNVIWDENELRCAEVDN